MLARAVFFRSEFSLKTGYAGAGRHVDRGINFPGRGRVMIGSRRLVFYFGFFVIAAFVTI